MSEKWSENLRNRLENYQQEMPDGLWDDLSVRLNENRQKVVIQSVGWRRWWAYAAVFAGMILSGLGVWFSYHIWSTQFGSSDNLTVKFPDTEESEPIHLSVHSFSHVSDRRMASSVVEPPVIRQSSELPVPASSVQKVDSVMESEEKNVVYSISNLSDSLTYTDSHEKKDEEYQVKPVLRHTFQSRKDVMIKKKKFFRHMTLAFAASHLPGASNLSYDGFGDINKGNFKADVSQMQWGESHFNDILLYNSDNLSETDIKHYQPLTVGVRMAYQFNERWSLETGLTYNLLRSDLRSGGSSYYYEASRNLHFIGLPVTASYTFWKWRQFNAYAGAGFWLEKCVAGHTQTDFYKNNNKVSSQSEHAMVDPLQCALTMAVGIQYSFNRNVGLYFEPGMLYHVQTHDQVETIYKEKPLNFNFEMGFRFSIPDVKL